MRSTHPCLIGTFVAALAIQVGTADAQHADALLALDPSGNLITGQFDFDTATVLNVDTRVYEGELEGPFTGVFTGDEPGFNALSSSQAGQLPAGYNTLTGNTDVNFTGKAFNIGATTANLWYWDGTGPVDFGAVTAPTQLEVSKAPAVSFSAVFDGSSSDVTGFAIDQTNSEGFLHKHIDFNLSNTDASTPDAGFYLWSFTFQLGDSGPESLPVYFVHGAGLDNETAHEEAIDWVQANVVPEPATALLFAGAAGCLMFRRRCRA